MEKYPSYLWEKLIDFISGFSPKNQHQFRLKKYLKQNEDVRFDLVEELSIKLVPPPQDLTDQELITLLVLHLSQKPINEAIHILYNHEGWMLRFDDALFHKIDLMCERLFKSGFEREARDLNKAAQVSAQIRLLPDWVDHFRKNINQRLQANISDMPFLKQRAW